MSDPTVLGAIITAAAAFVGVAVAEGAKLLSGRRAESESTRAETYRARKELLLAYRAFRRHLMQTDVSVVLQEELTGSETGKRHTVIHPAAEQWHRVDSAWIDFRLTDPPASLLKAGEELRVAWNDFARSRASHPPGTIPTAVLRSVRDAEHHYLDQLREQLPAPRS